MNAVKNSMTNVYPWLAALVLCAPASVAAQETSYARQVKPFLARYCLECHNASTTKGDLDLETFKGMMQGGKSGPVVMPGKPDASRLVLLPEHKDKPPMPPKKARQPKPDEVTVLRAWVAAGARDDSANVRVALPELKARKQRLAPLTTLAYSPDGKWLVAGQHKSVVIVNPAAGSVATKLPSYEDGKVTAVAFSPDQKRLAIAASIPGSSGEIQLLFAATGAFPYMAPQQAMRAGHKDAILDLAFSPDGRMLASTGYDRLIKLWDAATGTELRTLKDHSDAVYG